MWFVQILPFKAFLSYSLLLFKHVSPECRLIVYSLLVKLTVFYWYFTDCVTCTLLLCFGILRCVLWVLSCLFHVYYFVRHVGPSWSLISVCSFKILCSALRLFLHRRALYKSHVLLLLLLPVFRWSSKWRLKIWGTSSNLLFRSKHLK